MVPPRTDSMSSASLGPWTSAGTVAKCLSPPRGAQCDVRRREESSQSVTESVSDYGGHTFRQSSPCGGAVGPHRVRVFPWRYPLSTRCGSDVGFHRACLASRRNSPWTCCLADECGE